MEQLNYNIVIPQLDELNKQINKVIIKYLKKNKDVYIKNISIDYDVTEFHLYNGILPYADIICCYNKKYLKK